MSVNQQNSQEWKNRDTLQIEWELHDPLPVGIEWKRTGEAETNAIQLATREALGIRALQNFTDDAVPADSDEWTGPIPLLTRQEMSELAEVCPDASAEGSAVTVLSDSRAAIGTASNPPNRNARHFQLGRSFVRPG